MLKHWISLAAVSAAALILGGCGTPLRYDPTVYSPVKVGVILPLSGKDQNYGSRIKLGIDLAAEELNSTSGFAGRQVELVYADSESSPEREVWLLHKLYDRRGIVALIGGYSTNDVRALAPEVRELMLPTVVPMATADQFEEGQKEPNPMLFRSAFTDMQQGHVLAAYLWFWRGVRNLAILADVSPEAYYSRNNAKALREKFVAYGGNIVCTAEYDETQKDYTALIQKVLLTAPEAVMIPASPEGSARLVAAFRKQGYSGLLIGPDTWDETVFLQNCGPTPGDCAFTAFYAEEYDSVPHREFREQFRKRYFYYPSSCEAQGYDSLKLLGVALGKSATDKEFQENLLAIKGYFGATGQYSMLENGGIDRTIFIKTLRGINRPGHAAEAHLHLGLPYSKLAQFENMRDLKSETDDTSADKQ